MSSERNVPVTLFDSEKIIELRTAVQKPWEREEFWAWYTIRRVSIYISYFISKRTSITPNMLTLIGCLFGIFASISFFIGSTTFIYIGFILCQLTYLFDCVDGEVARLKKQTSKLGAWLDNGLRYSLLLADISLMFSIAYKFSSVIGFIVLYMSIISVLITILTFEGVESVLGESSVIDLSQTRKKNKLFDGMIFLFATSPGLYLGVYVLTLINNFYNIKLAIFIWVIIHFILYVIKAMYKLHLAYKKIANINH